MAQTFPTTTEITMNDEDMQSDMDDALLYLAEIFARENFNPYASQGRPRLFSREAGRIESDQNTPMVVDFTADSDELVTDEEMLPANSENALDMTTEVQWKRLDFAQKAPVKVVSAWNSAMANQNEFGVCRVSDIIEDGHSWEDIEPLGFSRGSVDIGKTFYGIARTFDHIQIDPVTLDIEITNGRKNIQLSPDFR